MADEETKDAPKEPQAGDPGYYSPPSIEVGVTRTRSNEVPQAEAGAGQESTDYEELTVPELKDLAEKRGIEVKSDWLKHDIIQALKG